MVSLFVYSAISESESHDLYSENSLSCHYDFDDADRRGNPTLAADTTKYFHAVYEGTALVSREELPLPQNAAVRMVQTADGTMYLLVCHLGETGAKIGVYCETEDGWALCAANELGSFTPEAFNVSSPRGGSVQDDVIDCLIYATDNDVYHVRISFAGGE